MAAATAEVADSFGRLDVLDNNEANEANEANAANDAIDAIDCDTWQRAVTAVTADLGSVREVAETNPYGPWRTAIAFAPLLRASAHVVCPGWVATDMGGLGGRPVEEGTPSVVYAATLPDAGRTAAFFSFFRFFRDGRPLPWWRLLHGLVRTM